MRSILRILLGSRTPPGPPAAPVADFAADHTSGSDPLSVLFSYTGTGGSPDSFDWQKNDGSGWQEFAGAPNDPTPTETFAEGAWDVKVDVSNSTGSDGKTKTGYIVVGPAAANTADSTAIIADSSLVTADAA
jgi:PKD repeat protein